GLSLGVGGVFTPLSHTAPVSSDMFMSHRRPAPGLEQSAYDSRISYPNAAGISGWIPPCRGAGGRSPNLRPRRFQVLDFRGIQQVPVTPVVGRAERCSANSGIRSPQWQLASYRAETRPKPPFQTG